MEQVDILAFGAHPDDIEFACGGILAKMAALDKSIALVDFTSGERGSHGDPEVREREGERAAKIIGATRSQLGFIDCEVVDSYEGRLEVVRAIRHYRPKLVLAPMWKGEQNHPDHLACGQMVRFACRYARFRSILPELPIHWVEGVLHYPPPSFESLDFIVDISEHVPTWKKMMEAHASQMLTFDYVDWNVRLAAKNGVLIGVGYAQGLVKGNPIVVEDVMQVAKGSREI